MRFVAVSVEHMRRRCGGDNDLLLARHVVFARLRFERRVETAGLAQGFP
jgi:hypothetical protein